MLSITTLASGSSGNCLLVSGGGTHILIDAGISCRRITTALNQLPIDPMTLAGVLVTHEHSDHVSALPVIARKHKIPIHFVAETAYEMKELPESAVLHEGLFDETVGNMRVEAFYTPHDSARSVGYIITCGKRRFGIATDMGVITRNVVEALAGCDCAMIESNYDETMLETAPTPAV